MFCSICGQKLPDHSVFCSKCGKKIDWPESSEVGSTHESTQLVLSEEAISSEAMNKTSVMRQDNDTKESVWTAVASDTVAPVKEDNTNILLNRTQKSVDKRKRQIITAIVAFAAVAAIIFVSIYIYTTRYQEIDSPYAEAMEKYRQMDVDTFEALPRGERLQYSQYRIDNGVSSDSVNRLYGEGKPDHEGKLEVVAASRDNTGQEIMNNYAYVLEMSCMQSKNGHGKDFDSTSAIEVLSSAFYDVYDICDYDVRVKLLSNDYPDFKDDMTNHGEIGLFAYTNSWFIVTNTTDLLHGQDENGNTIDYKIVTVNGNLNGSFYCRFFYYEFKNYDGTEKAIWLLDSQDAKVEALSFTDTPATTQEIIVDSFSQVMEKYDVMDMDTFNALPREEKLKWGQYNIDLTNFSLSSYAEGKDSHDFEVEYFPVSQNNTGQEILDNSLYVVQLSFLQEMVIDDESYPVYDPIDGAQILEFAFYNIKADNAFYYDYPGIISMEQSLTEGSCLAEKFTETETSGLLEGIDSEGNAVSYKMVNFRDNSGKDRSARFIYYEFESYDGTEKAVWLLDPVE